MSFEFAAERMIGKRALLSGLVACWMGASAAWAQGSLPGTAVLTTDGNLSDAMVAGIDAFLEAETKRAAAGREAFWKPDFSSDEAYVRSVQPNRERLARMIGAIDRRVAEVDMQFVASVAVPAKAAETDRFVAYAVRWPVLDGLEAEGLLLQPKGPIVARVVALPEADQTPEMVAGLAPGLSPELQYARRLAENGCEVIVPVLLDRSDAFSGQAANNTFTNHPHREWIYRQAFVLGRHPIGYEVQKILAVVDWFQRRNREGGAVKIGVAGWGEGGLLALHAAALDVRIASAVVSGYFGPRERLWQEPIYRNLFGVLNEFGDAELARLIVPRPLHLEHAASPRVDGPPAERAGRRGAAPGKLGPIALADVQAEVARARRLAGPHGPAIQLHHGPTPAPIGPLAERTLAKFLRSLGRDALALEPVGAEPVELRPRVEVAARQERTVRGIERHVQRQLQLAAGVRDAFLWDRLKPTTPDAWRAAMQPYREQANAMIGRFARGDTPLNPRARPLREAATWTSHEVVIDALPGVMAWGYMLVPKGIQPGEKRPVVVTQHGVAGLPQSVVEEDPKQRAHATYKAFAVRLAERGFIVFAPHNPYRGDHPSRVLQRKAQPIGKTIFSVILAQHEAILEWLATQPNVDPARIGFYGLSYGGQSAMRLPILLDGYALSVCSGDFNEWTWKNASVDFPKSYLYNNAYERPEFRMGLAFGYAEMAALLVPRPFMVERGHDDNVGIDEWVAHEYAKVNRLYNKLGIPERTAIEYFDGPHTIHGVGTFRFLHRHLGWPEPEAAASGAGGR